MKTMNVFYRYLCVLGLGFAALSVSAAEEVSYSGDGEVVDLAIEEAKGVAKLYLARKENNEPLSGVSPVLKADEGDSQVVFKATSMPGVYEAEIKDHLPEGSIFVTVDGVEDEIEVYENAVGGGGHEHGHDHSHGTVKPKTFAMSPGTAIFGGAFIFLLGFIAGRFRKSRKVDFLAEKHIVDGLSDTQDVGRKVGGLILVGAGVALLLNAKQATAEEGHSHGEVSIQDGASGGETKISKKSQFLIGIKTKTAKPEAIQNQFETVGHAIPAPDKVANIVATSTGNFKPSSALKVGSVVAKGEVLGVISNLGQVEVRSPIAGRIEDYVATSVKRVEVGETLLRVVDTKKLWIDAEVFQKDYKLIKNTQSILVSFSSEKEARIGKFQGYSTSVSEQTFTGKVYVEIDNADDQIPLGSFASISFISADNTKTGSQGYVFPRSAVLSRGGEVVAFVQTGPESFKQRVVTTKPGRFPGEVVVTSGINEGDRVVIQGNYQLLVAAH